MTQYSDLVILLPCHSLEDFPIHHQGIKASDLLASWTALWHPALIVTANSQPTWKSVDFLPDTWDSHVSATIDSSETDGEERPVPRSHPLIIIPAICDSAIESDWLLRQADVATILPGGRSRKELLASAWEHCDVARDLAAKVADDLASDFLALGYGFLQVQLMTRQLRFSSNLDVAAFERALITAAKLAVGQQNEPARAAITRCFDMLLEEKNAYYPVDPQLCDVVLTADTTLGTRLQQELSRRTNPQSILLTGQQTRRLAEEYPDSCSLLKSAIDADRCCVIGGLEQELPDWLMDGDTLIEQLKDGRQALQQVLGVVPTVFMRRRFGLHPAMPGILTQFQYQAVVHACLDQGTFPRSSSGIIRWTGEDEQSILAMGDLPLDASDDGSFIGLGVKIGQMIDSAHLASALLVHWPNASCDSMEDVIRISRYGPLLGKFVHLDQFFDSVYDPGYGETYAADEYRSPYLKQAVDRKQLDPVSRCTGFWQGRSQLVYLQGLLTQLAARRSLTDAQLNQHWQDLDALRQGNARMIDQADPDRAVWNAGLDRLRKQLVERLGSLSTDGVATAAVQRQWFNGTSQKQRLVVKPPNPRGNRGYVKNKPPVALAVQQPDVDLWVVDVPGMGTVILNPDQVDRSNPFQKDPAIVQPGVLQNEFFIASIDEVGGGLRSIQLHGKRGNLISQQLAVRVPTGSGQSEKRSAARYSSMVCEAMEIVESTPLSGAIQTRGVLQDQDDVIGRFEQTLRVVRGIPRLQFEMKLDMMQPLTDNLNHYVCARFAWKQESARLVANTIDSHQPVTSQWCHATRFVVVGDDPGVTLLTGGLPFHRRSNRRMLDSLLVVGQERARQFKLAIDVNRRYASSAGEHWLQEPLTANGLPAETDAESNLTSWLFHFDCRNILVSWQQPVIDSNGRWTGIKFRFRETEGRSVTLKLRSARPIASVQRTRFDESPLQTLEVDPAEPNLALIPVDRFAHQQVLILFHS